ncbi:pyocin knob domain-containing protein [Moraxella pluranimalium]|uniref:Uncharacterized protein n=1 Tax=Moraxella pluranimalium TaxID=470453 RepID=A0A1T0CQR0_9GAMM|nr:pyocin knob domain-containing protein [Moraxella pluranimalium]OOS24644.1 hypothetical protein B0680_04240 [Moraxella pluranimalium]
MANLAESSIWETGVYQIEENDPVHGGANGITNRPTKQLANRTVWLKNELASSVQAINANLTSLSTNKADKTLNLVAGNGLTGGGTLQANRTITLGTPSQITASTTNSVTATSHTHAIDKASTTTQGIVQLNDTLVSTATDQALTANQGKVLNDKITATDAKADTKANQATAITAGNGLTGGGTLQANRTLTLGTPSQITASSTNAVTATSHTHAIDKASTTVAGVVQLVDNLTTDDAAKALTAKQGKVLNDKIDNKDSLKTIDWVADKSSNYQLTGFYRANAIMMGSDALPAMEMHITHPTSPGNGNARGIGFAYGPRFDLSTTAWDAQGVYLGQKTILTELNGVMLSDKSNSIELDDAGKVATSKAVYTLNQAKLDKAANAVSASRLATARTINGVAFDGTANITIADNTKAPAVHRHNWNEINGKPSTFTPSSHTHSISNITDFDVREITSESLDDITKWGIYAQMANSNATAERKYPVPAEAGTLEVIISTYGLRQRFTTFNTHRHFERRRNNPMTGWENWVEVSNTWDAIRGKPSNLAYTSSNVASATRLQTARTISLTGAVTGSVSFDGSGNVSIGTTLPSIASNVVVMTGTIDHGGTIPLPNGFTESQCKWMVSMHEDNTGNATWDLWESARLRHYGFRCFCDGRIVTAQAYLTGHNSPPGWVNGRANYIIIGVK